jgi:DNA-binding CsgD family transcriptional regulator
MPKSWRLILAQVRVVYRLVDECRELGDEPDRWLPHLLGGINAVVGAAFGMAAELSTGGPAGPRVDGFTSVGLPPQHVREGVRHFLQAGGFSGHPVTARFAALPGPRNTRLRRDLLTDDEWYGSAFFREWHRPVGLDDGILSVHAGPGGCGFLLCPSRALGDRPFGRRDARVIHLTQLALTPHLGRSLATSRDPAARLSARLRQTLDGLLEGDGEKQAALRLGVSPATVREYVQALYRLFGVSTRAELMAHFLRRYRGRPDPGGAWGRVTCGRVNVGPEP